MTVVGDDGLLRVRIRDAQSRYTCAEDVALAEAADRKRIAIVIERLQNPRDARNDITKFGASGVRPFAICAFNDQPDGNR